MLYYLINFPTSPNYLFLWNIGFSLYLYLIYQVITGIFISFYIDFGFKVIFSKIYILNNIKYGWFFLKSHCIIPNFIFLLIYFHIFKGLISFSYYYFKVWFSGSFLYLLFVVVAFTGYSLVLGAMGYWAIIVVTNIIKFIIGGYLSVCLFFDLDFGPTASSIIKLFTFHYLFSFMVFISAASHIHFLHLTGSSNGLHPEYCFNFSFLFNAIFKDVDFVVFIYSLTSHFVFGNSSTFLLSGDNFIEYFDNKSLELLVEWYVRFFFIILRSVGSKIWGMYFSSIFIISLTSFSFLGKNLFRSSFIGNLIFGVLLLLYPIITFSSFIFSSYLNTISIFLLILHFIFLNNFLDFGWFLKYYFFKYKNY